MASIKKRIPFVKPESEFEKSLEEELSREWLRLHEILSNGQFNKLQITDGIEAPATISGQASIYIDEDDGDLKIKFGNGAVKTISVDS